MPTKRKVCLILVLVLVVGLILGLIALAVGCSQFFSEGVHVLGRYVHIDFQQKCFFIDPDTKEVTGESTFTASGYLFDRHYSPFSNGHAASLFDGHMDVDAYPISLKDGFHNHYGAIGQDVITLSCQGMVTADSQPAGTYYIVEILKSNPEIVVIYIYSGSESASVAVCGTDGASAADNYQQYLALRFS